MGRYYSGDIEGKFWFAVQSSEDASFFGGEQSQPNHIDYYFYKTDLPDIKKGLADCHKSLREYEKKLNKFFGKGGEGYNGYNDKMLEKELKLSEKKVKDLLVWYARLELGEKILKCVKEKGSCEFEAEY